MNDIEDRLRDAMTARARTIDDDTRPLPPPHRTVRGHPLRVTAVALALAVTVLGVVRFAAVSAGGGQEKIVAMSLSGAASSDRPEVAVFLCKDDDAFPGCAGGAITAAERENLQRAMTTRPEVESVAFEDRKLAWESFRRRFPKYADEVRPEDMPESFRLQLRPGANIPAVAQALSELPGVSNSVDQSCMADRGSWWGVIAYFLGLGDQCTFLGKGR
ncbi:hypothetical protein Sru01_27750 [Sphaerisporangium rufum]|uniref:FtsX extracellular domain-containing protein n=1 Tax=Sphaerisporangium rufum TaxID=1381558 RepID=A0A919R1U7_9ACTN|nr:permease-like cell division protein FtsX [Sphaerisporangium rufum]GII77793.1 hypothetical protein Sru01_27750 [Sphaerisporangium rufum]